MSNTNEKSAFEKQFEGVDEKVMGSMLVLARMMDLGNAEEELLKHVKESYTNDELAYITCLFIGKQLRSALEGNPRLIELVKMIRQVDSLGRKVDDYL